MSFYSLALYILPSKLLESSNLLNESSTIVLVYTYTRTYIYIPTPASILYIGSYGLVRSSISGLP